MLIELHAHTCLGSEDSVITPELLVQAARGRGIQGICITDHNSYAGVEEARAWGSRTGVLVIQGIELSTVYGHLLVYGVDVYQMCSISRDQLTDLLREKERYGIEDLKQIYVPLFAVMYTDISSLIDRVHAAGGAVVLAHPFGGYDENTRTLRYFMEQYVHDRPAQAREHPSLRAMVEAIVDFVREEDKQLHAICQKVDAIEVENALSRAAENRAADYLARYLGKNRIGTSDCHSGWQIALCATRFSEGLRTEAEFLTYLRSDRKTTPVVVG